MKRAANKIPTPGTIARHYAQGRHCDYPTDTVLSAVNSFDHDYDSRAIPVRVGFEQFALANLGALVYLGWHHDEESPASEIYGVRALGCRMWRIMHGLG